MKETTYSVFFLITIALIFLPLPYIVADEKVEQKQENIKNHAFQQEEYYVITKITYEITGHVLEAALEEKLQLKNGSRKFKSEKNLQMYLENKNAELINIRTLEASSKITFTKTYDKEKKQYNITLTIQVKSGFNILVLPYFKYSSNSGLLLSARGRDYNFLGSLQRFVIDLDYTYDDNNRNSGSISTSFQYPLQIGNKNLFTLALSENISYRSDNKFYNKASFAIQHSYSINSIISWNSSLSQDFTSETDLKTAKKRIFSTGSSILTTGSSILLTSTPLPVINNIRYNPSISTRFDYSLTSKDPSPRKRYNIIPSFDQSLSFGQINEIKNFRQGLALVLQNKNSYSIKNKIWRNSISIETKLHGAFGNIFGIDARIYGVQNFYTYLDSSKKNTEDEGSMIGNRLRGVLDNNFKNANNALAINVSLLLKLFSITPFTEFHLGLFSDFGIRTRRGKNSTFSLEKDIKATIGVEILSFALFSRSIILRISYGVDLTKAIHDGKLESSNREIFIGLSRYF